jgi:hypothetical protein
VLAKPIAFPLLTKNIRNSGDKAFVEYDVFEFEAWLSHLQEPLDAPTRLSERDSDGLSATRFGARLVNLRAKLFSRLPVALSRFSRCNLERDRVKRILIAFGAAS